MSTLITAELEALRTSLGADVVVLWERLPSREEGRIAAIAPMGLMATGTPWPALPDADAEPTLASTPRAVGAAVPAALRLALPRPAQAAWSAPLPERSLGVCLVWGDEPTGQDLDSAARLVSGEFAQRTAEFQLRQRLGEQNRRLTSVMDLLGQAVVMIDELNGEAVVNAAAAHLLNLPPGTHGARQAADALRALQERSLDQDAIQDVGRQLATDPRARVDGAIWTFDTMPTHVRVTTSPIDESGITGRVWVLDDLSVQMAALTVARDARTRYELLAEHASDIVFRSSPDGVLEWVSESVEATLGWTPREMAGRRLATLVHADDIPVMQRAAQEANSTAGSGQRTVYRARFGCKDGSYRWLEVSALGVLDEAGRVLARIGSARDVTTQVEIQQALELSEERLRAVADGMLDPQVLLSPVRDAEGTITDFTYIEVNRVTSEYLSMPREALAGTTLLASSPGVRETGLFALYVRAMESDAPVIVDDFLYDNEILGVVRRYDIRANRVGDELSLTWRDVTDRHDAQQAVADSEERYRLLAENASDIVAHARDGLVTWMSPSVQESFDRPAEAWVGCRVEECIHPEDVGLFAAALPGIDAGGVVTVRLRMQVPGSDEFHWIDARVRQYLDRLDVPDGIIASIRVVDDLVRAESELDRRARFDDLTGLANRGEALATFTRLTRRSQRTGEQIAVLFCDVDLFKSVNDVHGHAAGDEVLTAVSQRITAHIRTDDTAARMGGDEFLVLLIGVREMADAVTVAEKIRQSVMQPIPHEGEQLQVTVSIGVALAGADEGIDAIMARADVGMYDAKKSGRNQVVAIG